MKSLFKYMKPYKWLAIVSPLMMMGEVACDLCLPYFMSYIVNYGILGMDGFDVSLAEGPTFITGFNPYSTGEQTVKFIDSFKEIR